MTVAWKLYLRRCFCSNLSIMSDLRAIDLERLHGAELRQLGDATAGMMLQILRERHPRIRTTLQAVRTWRNNYLRDSAQRISAVDELEARHGDELRGNLQDLRDKLRSGPTGVMCSLGKEHIWRLSEC